VQDRTNFGAHPALPVPDGDPDWEIESPQTAEEYLKRVRWEAAHCEQITRSDIDATQFDERRTQYVPRVRSVADAPLFCQPTTTWIIQTLKDFHKLRKHFESLSQEEDEELPIGVPILVNHRQLNENANVVENGLQSIENGISPDMERIAALDQVDALQLVKTHIGGFLKLRKLEEVTDIRCYWLYALLTRIHRPLHDTTAAAVRSLFKHCTHFRARCAHLMTSGSEQELTPVDVTSVLPRINLLYAISGVYFGQDEKMTGIVDLNDLND